MTATILPAAAGLPVLPPDNQAWPIVLTAGGLVVAALGAHASAALLSYSPTKLGRMLVAANRPAEKAAALSARVEHLHQHEHEYEVVAWLLVVLGFGLAVPGAAALASSAGAWIYVLLPLAAVLPCAGLPVMLARARAETMVLVSLPVLRAARAILRYPLIVPVSAVARALLRAGRVAEETETDPEQIADNIMAAVTDSAQDNALEDEERHWIENIVELKELSVSEAMTPRTDVVAFEAGMDLTEAVRQATEHGFSRFPVYEEKVDRIIGVFYAKDALARLGNGASKHVPVREVMREPLFVPESMGVIELLRQFKTTKRQMAIVLDEYGGTAGIISIEDILEEIVGDITDEFDADEEEPIRVITPERVVEISGRARVDEVNQVIGDAIPEDGEYDTVAGYVFTALGKIPKAGETVRIDGISFEILRADDRRIGRMRLTLPAPAPAPSEAG